MPYEFTFTEMPAAVGGALMGAADRRLDFQQEMEKARLEIERQRLNLDRAKLSATVSDLEWQRQAKAQEEARKASADRVQAAVERTKLGLAVASGQREQVRLQDDLAGGPEDRRGALLAAQDERQRTAGLEKIRFKADIEAPEKAAAAAAKAQAQQARMVQAGWRQVEAGKPAAGPRQELVDGSVWEFQPKERYGEFVNKTISQNSREASAQMQRRKDAIAETTALQKQLEGKLDPATKKLVYEGDAPMVQQAQARLKELAAVPTDAEARIAKLDQENRRLIDKLLPKEEQEYRKMQEAAAVLEEQKLGAAAEKGFHEKSRLPAALYLGEKLATSGKLDADLERMRQMALEALRSGSEGDRRRGAATLLKLMRMVWPQAGTEGTDDGTL